MKKLTFILMAPILHLFCNVDQFYTLVPINGEEFHRIENKCGSFEVSLLHYNSSESNDYPIDSNYGFHIEPLDSSIIIDAGKFEILVDSVENQYFMNGKERGSYRSDVFEYKKNELFVFGFSLKHYSELEPTKIQIIGKEIFKSKSKTCNIDLTIVLVQ